MDCSFKQLIDQLNRSRKIYDDNRDKTIQSYLEEFGIIEDYISFSLNLGCHLDSLIPEPEKPFLQFALLRIHEQSCKVYHEATILMENGSASGAMARWRTLFELSVVANILVKYPDLAKKYIEYSKISDFKFANKLNKYREKLNLTHYNMDAYPLIEQDYKKAKAEYGWEGRNSYEWAINDDIKNPNLFTLAQNIGQEYMYAYVDEAHMYNHPSPRYILNDLGVTPTQHDDHIRYLFSPFDLNLPLQLIVISLHQVNCACIIGYSELETADISEMTDYLHTNNNYPKMMVSLIETKCV